MAKINTMWCIFSGVNLPNLRAESLNKLLKALAVCKLTAWINSFIHENNWQNPILSGIVFKASDQGNK